MKVEELLQYGNQFLHKDQVRMLLSNFLGYTPIELYNHLQESVSQETIDLFKKSMDALLTNQPIQYVLGNVNFYGNVFKVNKSVLIPRFETEELVENTLHYIETFWDRPVKILDLGCGSGVIGITLKKKLQTSEVTLVDISKEALCVARENAMSLQAEVRLLESDFLEQVTGCYDVVISNPPYIREEEVIEDIVKENEPALALYAGKDGLDSYRSILSQIKTHLSDRYLLAFEIGCEQKEAVEELVYLYLGQEVTVETKQDLQGRNRMVFVFSNLV